MAGEALSLFDAWQAAERHWRECSLAYYRDAALSLRPCSDKQRKLQEASEVAHQALQALLAEATALAKALK